MLENKEQDGLFYPIVNSGQSNGKLFIHRNCF